MIDNNSMWGDLPFCNYNLSTDWTENQISFDSGNSISVTSEVCLKLGNAFYLNVNSLWSKKEERRHPAQLENASVTGINETKLDQSLLKDKIVILSYDRIRLDRSGKESELLTSSNTLSHKVINPTCVLTKKVFLQS